MSPVIQQSILDELQQDVKSLETYTELLERKLEVTKRLQDVQRKLGEAENSFSISNDNDIQNLTEIKSEQVAEKPASEDKKSEVRLEGSSSESEPAQPIEKSTQSKKGGKPSPLPSPEEVYNHYREKGKEKICIDDIMTDYKLDKKSQYQSAWRMVKDKLPGAGFAEAKKEKGQWVATLT